MKERTKLPFDNLPFYNKVMDKTAIKKLISRLIDHFGMTYTSHILDQLKTSGFQQATDTAISFMSLSRPRMGLTKIPWIVPQSFLRTTMC